MAISKHFDASSVRQIFSTETPFEYFGPPVNTSYITRCRIQYRYTISYTVIIIPILSGAIALRLCLTSGECPRTHASDSVLPEWQLWHLSQYYSSLLPGVRSQRKLQQIQELTVGQGASLLKSACGCGDMAGPFLINSLWRKLRRCAKRGCRNPGHKGLRLCGAGTRRPMQRGLPLHSEFHWVLHTAPDIVTYIVVDIAYMM